MAGSLNRCEFIGNIGNIESRLTQEGDEVVNISIAVNESWKDKHGEKKESTTWVPIVIFGKLANVCSTYLKKGSKIFIAGKYRVRKWQDQSGQDRYTTEIVANEMQMLDSRMDGSSSGGYSEDQQSYARPSSPKQPPQSTSQVPSAPSMDAFDDDIPF